MCVCSSVRCNVLRVVMFVAACCSALSTLSSRMLLSASCTHCNTVQHTVRHTAPHCNTLQRTLESESRRGAETLFTLHNTATRCNKHYNTKHITPHTAAYTHSDLQLLCGDATSLIRSGTNEHQSHTATHTATHTAPHTAPLNTQPHTLQYTF